MTRNEVHLAGGRTTTGVVRIGDTVRRPPALNVEFVRALLKHLERSGFDGAPRYLGADEHDREILSDVPRQVPAELGHHDDATLQTAACLVRAYHDATAPLFETPSGRIAGIEVACHNDLSPCNTVFRDGRPVALIDFDAAAPGSRAFDLGYAAWLWLDLGNAEYAAEEQRRRLGVFLAAYGTGLKKSGVIAATIERQSILVAEGAHTGNATLRDWAEACKAWTVRHMTLPSDAEPGNR
ncbi:MAG: phosphotransferase [Rhizomicrobium sp.]